MYRIAELLIVACFLLFAAVWVPNAFAQDSQDPDDTEINEQTIYIPYEKLKEIFEKDGRGVFLPYDKFQQLWEQARARRPEQTDHTAPLGALITDIESVATLGKEIVNVDATLKIELLKEGWHRIPLRLSGSAIRNASIDDQPARVVAADNGGYELLVSHSGDEPKNIELKISYAKSLTKSGGQSSVGFASPQAPVNRWTIRTGQKDIDLQIEPMIATTKQSSDDEPADGVEPADNDESDKEDESDDGDDDQPEGDVIRAFVGAAPQVRLHWTPKSEGAAGLDALVTADTQMRFQIEQGVARTSGTISLDISRSEVDSVSVTVPGDQKVVNVFDRNVKKWDVNKTGDEQTIEIELFEPVLGKQHLSIELENFIKDVEDQSISVPQIEVDDVSRNRGVVVVNLASDLRSESDEKSGLIQIDASELPAAMKNRPGDFNYRYSALPFELSLSVKKIQPQIHVRQLVEMDIQPEQMQIELSALYDIKLAGVFETKLDIPEDYTIRDIRPLTRKGLQTIPVDGFDRDEEQKNQVIVTFGRKALGQFGLLISLERELKDFGLSKPSDELSKIAVEVPQASLDDVEFSKGSVVVYAPASLQVNSGETEGLRSESFQTAFANHSAMLRQSDSIPTLAFSFSHSEASLEIEAKRRQPQVSAEQVVIVSVQSGVVKYDARLFYEILYSNVDSLRLDVPTDLAGDLRIRSPEILHETLDPQPDDVPEGYTAWQLTSNNPFFGKQQIRLTWEKPIEDLPLGESIDLKVSRLIPQNVHRASGQVVLTKTETIDIRPHSDAVGLRPIDPQTDLSHGVSIGNASMAFEFVDDWQLNLTATRFELQDLKRTSISRAVVRVVALRQQELSVQCLYQVRSVGQRLALQMPAGFDAEMSFDDQPIRINGRRVTPERGGPNLIYVPLTAQTTDEPFLLELRYTIAGSPSDIELPVFTDQPAVQKVYVCTYLPHEQALVAQSGPWTDEAIDPHAASIAALVGSRHSRSLLDRMFNRRSENVEALLNWVRHGVNCDPSSSQNFEVDGRPYVFSALRPEPPPAGSLHLRTMKMVLLNVLVCGALVLLGLLLLRSGITAQLAGAVALVAALMILGIFFPLITEHLFGEAFLLTIVAVGLAWAVFDFTRFVRQVQKRRTEIRAESQGSESSRNASDSAVETSEESTEETDIESPSEQSEEGGDR